ITRARLPGHAKRKQRKQKRRESGDYEAQTHYPSRQYHGPMGRQRTCRTSIVRQKCCSFMRLFFDCTPRVSLFVVLVTSLAALAACAPQPPPPQPLPPILKEVAEAPLPSEGLVLVVHKG